jgi:hypothetical protein
MSTPVVYQIPAGYVDANATVPCPACSGTGAQQFLASDKVTHTICHMCLGFTVVEVITPA